MTGRPANPRNIPQRTLEEFTAHCQKHEDTIFVRHKLRGKWGNYPLAELSKEEQGVWIRKWWEWDWIPNRTKG